MNGPRLIAAFLEGGDGSFDGFTCGGLFGFFDNLRLVHDYSF
jgi:hypothetical protein